MVIFVLAVLITCLVLAVKRVLNKRRAQEEEDARDNAGIYNSLRTRDHGCEKITEEEFEYQTEVTTK